MALVDAGRVVRIWRWTLEGLRTGARAYDGAGPMTGARASPGASAGVGIGEAGAVGGGACGGEQGAYLWSCTTLVTDLQDIGFTFSNAHNHLDVVREKPSVIYQQEEFYAETLPSERQGHLLLRQNVGQKKHVGLP